MVEISWHSQQINFLYLFFFLFPRFYHWIKGHYWTQSPWSSNLLFSHAHGLCFPKILIAYSNCPSKMPHLFLWSSLAHIYHCKLPSSAETLILHHWPVHLSTLSTSSLWCLKEASHHFLKFMTSYWSTYSSNVLHHRDWPIHSVVISPIPETVLSLWPL